jgi:glutathione-regulated potassium-efflux system ancillary protein KefG
LRAPRAEDRAPPRAWGAAIRAVGWRGRAVGRYAGNPVPRLLILFAHPALERSRVHARLLAHLPSHGITLNDLYEHYPDFDIDVKREQALLLDHDVIVFQHPFFWYSTPPLLKQWEDLVLEHGWAYGRRGTALAGKRAMHIITTGGREEAYHHEGYNRFTMRELLAPLEQTAYLCGMTWVPPYVVHGTHRLTEAQIEHEAVAYGELLVRLAGDRLDLDAASRFPTLNDALADATAGVRR